MSNLQVIAAKLDAMEEARKAQDERIEKKLDRINGKVAEHEKRVRDLEIEDEKQKGRLNTFKEGYRVTKSFVATIIAISVTLTVAVVETATWIIFK